uniref:Thyroglobulin type-1 domain-containing protein n=1 Tax=Caenorhabditis japonica TaxID=281687 RepID=A0A8R1HK26_CAEJA
MRRTRKGTVYPQPLRRNAIRSVAENIGYYESVQCNSESCYCVTPHTALIAYDTRTSSPKTAPKCGTCLVYLQKLFANGDPPENSFVPKCDVSKGDFEPVQCENQKNQCYCVDTKTGREVPGTRNPLSNTVKMNCMNIDFSIDSLEFPAFEKPDATKSKEIEPIGKPWCNKNRDPGFKCHQNSTQIRYWFDVQTFQCLPFEHKGRTTTTTPGPLMNEDGCPHGYRCQNGAFFGICCEEDLTNRYQAAFKPVCNNKKPALIQRNDGWESAVIGKACSDRFCPSSHTCEHNEFFAFCCPK